MCSQSTWSELDHMTDNYHIDLDYHRSTYPCMQYNYIIPQTTFILAVGPQQTFIYFQWGPNQHLYTGYNQHIYILPVGYIYPNQHLYTPSGLYGLYISQPTYIYWYPNQHLYTPSGLYISYIYWVPTNIYILPVGYHWSIIISQPTYIYSHPIGVYILLRTILPNFDTNGAPYYSSRLLACILWGFYQNLHVNAAIHV